MPDRYDPEQYWDRRLAAHSSLRGTGHLSYSEGYNRWLYRAKGIALRKALGPPAPVQALDAGSGVGWVVEQLLARGATVEGCDISPTAVELLSRRFPGVPFFQLALGTDPIPRPEGSYDLATALDVTYHITDDGLWRSALNDLARVLRPGGALVVLDAFGDEERVPAEHVRFRSLATWEEAAQASGLRVEAVVPAYRWLSRDNQGGVLSHVPGSVRGACEFALEVIARRPPHMRCVRFRRDGT